MQIHWRNPHAVRDADRHHATSRIEALANGQSDMIDVRIDVSESRHHRHGDGEVVIHCQARGRDIVARRRGEEPGRALRDALAAFERDVRKWREHRTGRRTERPALPPRLGIVDRVLKDAGYGFVLTDAGEQVYFQAAALTGNLALETLSEGDRVGLDYAAGEKGLQAVFVAPAPPDAPAP